MLTALQTIGAENHRRALAYPVRALQRGDTVIAVFLFLYCHSVSSRGAADAYPPILFSTYYINTDFPQLQAFRTFRQDIARSPLPSAFSCKKVPAATFPIKKMSPCKLLDFQGFTHFPQSFPQPYVNLQNTEKVPVQLSVPAFTNFVQRLCIDMVLTTLHLCDIFLISQRNKRRCLL